jgi:hypothetical protein
VARTPWCRRLACTTGIVRRVVGGGFSITRTLTQQELEDLAEKLRPKK